MSLEIESMINDEMSQHTR